MALGGPRWPQVALGVGPLGPKVYLTRVSPKGEHKTSTRPDDPKGSADICMNITASNICMTITASNICINITASKMHEY